MQQPRPEDLQCYSKAISTQNESISLSANIIRKYLALTQALFIHESQCFTKAETVSCPAIISVIALMRWDKTNV